MKVIFHPRNNREDYHTDNRVLRIVNLLLNDERFFKDVALILTNSFTLEQFMRQYENIGKFWYHKIGKEYIIDHNSGKSSHKTFEDLFNALKGIYKDKTKTKELRGAIVEVYVHNCLNENYHEEDKISLECHVEIDGWISSRTVDVGAVEQDVNYGECYECKLGIGSIKMSNFKEQVKNLIEIHIKSNNILTSKIASFSYKEKVINILNDSSIQFPESEIYGLNELTSCPFH